jgi:hypothetical protein
MREARSNDQVKPAPVALEKIRPELNLEKWSIWQPSNSRNPLKARVIEREIALADGSRVKASVEIGFTQRGTVTTEDQKTYYALVKYWEERGRSDKLTVFSLRGLAKILKKKWGTNSLEALTESLARLYATPFFWSNAYYDNATKETKKELEGFRILDNLKIVQTSSDGHITREAGYFKFNDFILGNLLANHTKPLFLDIVLNFKSEVAQLLYVHLDLVLANKNQYERRTKELFDDLGLEGKAYSKNSKRNQVLRKALKELQGVEITTGRIASATLERTKDGRDYKVIFRKEARLARKAASVTEESREETPVPLPVKAQITLQAEELVRYFHKVFQGAEKAYTSTKAVDQAVSLIAQHGFDQAKYIIDFSHTAAAETHYKPQTFGGILQYTTRALADYDRQQSERERVTVRESAEAARRRQEIEEREAYRKAAIRLKALSVGEYQALYDQCRTELAAEPGWQNLDSPAATKVFEMAVKAAMIKKLQESREQGEDTGEETISSAIA